MDTSGYKIRPSKHFILTWMRKWDYDVDSLRNALESAYKMDKVGKHKYETYTRAKGKSRKLIFINHKLMTSSISIGKIATGFLTCES